jgi:hypothetical protein
MAIAFDSSYYLEQYPDVAEAVENGIISAEEHWEMYGADEGRNPNAVFNTEEYLAANPDVAASGMNPLDHFLQYGAGEGRAPSAAYQNVAANFDNETYLAANPDVAAAIESGAFASGYEHWVIYGQFEEGVRTGAQLTDGTPASEAIGEGEVASDLTEALEDLQAANAAKADFLEENETTEAAINDNLDALETDLASARADVSDRVLNARLQDAQDAVAAARANIDSVPGLTSAVATLEDAQDALEAAQDTRADAVANVAGARASFETRNADATVGYVGYEVSVDGELVIALNDSGTLVVTEAGAQVDGINTLLAAHQALQAADADLASAEEAVESAQAVVNELDLTAAAVELQEARDEAQAELQAHVRANGSTEALETQLADAQAALAESVADSEAVIAAQAAVEDAQAALDTRAELAGAVEAAQTALADHVAEFGETADLEQAVTEADAAVNDRGELVQAVEDAQGAVDAREALVQDVADAQALVDQRDALAQTVADLEAAQAARPGLEQAVTDAQTAVDTAINDGETGPIDGDDATVAEIEAEADALENNVTAAQDNVDDFDAESTTFTDAQGVVADLTTMAEGIQAVTWDTDEATTEAVHDAITAQAVTDGVITSEQKTAIDTAFADALTVEGDLASAKSASASAYESIVADADTALTEAGNALFVETAVPDDLTLDLATEIEAEGTARNTALTEATEAQSDFADLVTTLNDAQAALQASIDEYGSDTQLTADLAQAQLELETFDAENGDVSQALTDAEGALQTDIDENGDDAALQAALTNAQNALIAARATVSDEALTQELADAQALVDQRTELDVALNGDGEEVLGAEGELQADIAANGETEALETALADAQEALDAAISEGDPELVAQVDALQATLADRAELQAAADDAQADFEAAAATNPRVDTLETALAAEETAQDAVDVRTEMIAEVEAAQALADTLEELNAGIEGAEEAIEELGFELPITAEDSVFGTAGDDIFLFAGEDATISGFNATGDDLLYVGAGFTRTDLESDIDLTATREGSADTLEVFFQQDGNNAVLSFEEVEFAGGAANGFEGDMITLTGVNVDDLTLNAEGFVTIA